MMPDDNSIMDVFNHTITTPIPEILKDKRPEFRMGDNGSFEKVNEDKKS